MLIYKISDLTKKECIFTVNEFTQNGAVEKKNLTKDVDGKTCFLKLLNKLPYL